MRHAGAFFSRHARQKIIISFAHSFLPARLTSNSLIFIVYQIFRHAIRFDQDKRGNHGSTTIPKADYRRWSQASNTTQAQQ